MSSHKKSSGKGGSESVAALQQSNMHEPEWTEDAKHLQIWDMEKIVDLHIFCLQGSQSI